GRRLLTYGALPGRRGQEPPSAPGEARIWDVATGRPLTPPLRHFAEVYQAGFSPDGRRMVTASLDRTAQVWEAATGQALTPPLPHSRPVVHAAFSLDGRRVVTVSGAAKNVDLDTSGYDVRIWDAATGRPLTPPWHHAQRPGVQLSPDGRFLAASV